MRFCWTILLLLAGCGLDGGDPRFPINLAALQYEFRDLRDGVFPSDGIFRDENNPFLDTGIGSEALAFEIISVGSPPATYYAWATLLAESVSDPGVAQYFAATGLQGTYEADAVTDNTDIDDVRLQAIAAYQSLLDNFPATRLDIDGRGITFTRLATPSYLSIVELGGTPQGNWQLIETTDDDGNVTQIVVQGGGEPVLFPENPPEEQEEED